MSENGKIGVCGKEMLGSPIKIFELFEKMIYFDSLVSLVHILSKIFFNDIDTFLNYVPPSFLVPVLYVF